MTNVESTRAERRIATRYPIRGQARLFWPGGDSALVDLADMSASGCSIVARSVLPTAGTRVFLSLDIGGLPNVRLPAVAVRSDSNATARGTGGAVRFVLPHSSAGGLDRLLAQHSRMSRAPFRVLLIDSQVRTRERIAQALQLAGAEVTSVSTANDAMLRLRSENIAMVLARGDLEGLSALGALGRVSPETFRVVFGRGSARDEALRLRLAQASADDPCSAKCLGALLQDRLAAAISSADR
ncbi:MAG: PilZ domain-containing protein [Myxococcales bacterium]